MGGRSFRWSTCAGTTVRSMGETRIARFHNCYGSRPTWRAERSSAACAASSTCQAICTPANGVYPIEIWGMGSSAGRLSMSATCGGVYRLMHSDFTGPVNIGSEEQVSIDRAGADDCEGGRVEWSWYTCLP